MLLRKNGHSSSSRWKTAVLASQTFAQLMDCSLGHAVPNHSYIQREMQRGEWRTEPSSHALCYSSRSIQQTMGHNACVHSTWEHANYTICLTMSHRQQLLLWGLVNNNLVGCLKQRIKWILQYKASKLNLIPPTQTIFFLTNEALCA